MWASDQGRLLVGGDAGGGIEFSRGEYRQGGTGVQSIETDGWQLV